MQKITLVDRAALTDLTASRRTVGEVLVTETGIKTEPWTAIRLKPGQTWLTGDNFQSIDLLVLDIDNDPDKVRLSLPDAIERFKNYKCIIGTTRNHGIVKSTKAGNLKPADDRYRVILFFDCNITDKEVYKSNWEHYVEEFRVEGSVDSTQDMARFFYPCKTIAFVNETGLTLPVLKLSKQKLKTEKLPMTSGKGKLSRSTLEFIAQQRSNDGWHKRFIKAALDLKAQLYSKEEAQEMLAKASPINELDSTDLKQLMDVYHKRESFFATKLNNKELTEANEALKKKILDSIFIKDITKERNPYLVNIETNHREHCAEDTIRNVLTKEEWALYKDTCIHYRRFEYEPYKNKILSTSEEGIPTYNQYEPPFWQVETFFKGAAAPEKLDEIPPLIGRFINHLVNHEAESYEYLLDWLATAVRGRNYTVLTLIGNEGIGKGTLSTLMSNVFGSSNFTKVRANIFKGKFNSQLENKRLVLLDELQLTNSDEYALFRDLVNDYVEVEAKGKDARNVKNYCNFILASNESTAIKPPPGDRRFSLVSLNTTKITQTDLIKHINELNSSKELAFEFVRYLLYRPIKNNMMAPFKSASKHEEILEAGLFEWERYFIYEYIEDKVGMLIPLDNLKLHLEFECRMSRGPGKDKMKKLADRFPDLISLVVQENKRYIKVKAKLDTKANKDFEEIEGVHIIWKQPLIGRT